MTESDYEYEEILMRDTRRGRIALGLAILAGVTSALLIGASIVYKNTKPFYRAMATTAIGLVCAGAHGGYRREIIDTVEVEAD